MPFDTSHLVQLAETVNIRDQSNKFKNQYKFKHIHYAPFTSAWYVRHVLSIYDITPHTNAYYDLSY